MLCSVQTWRISWRGSRGASSAWHRFQVGETRKTSRIIRNCPQKGYRISALLGLVGLLVLLCSVPYPRLLKSTTLWFRLSSFQLLTKLKNWWTIERVWIPASKKVITVRHWDISQDNLGRWIDVNSVSNVSSLFPPRREVLSCPNPQRSFAHNSKSFKIIQISNLSALSTAQCLTTCRVLMFFAFHAWGTDAILNALLWWACHKKLIRALKPCLFLSVSWRSTLFLFLRRCLS